MNGEELRLKVSEMILNDRLEKALRFSYEHYPDRQIMLLLSRFSRVNKDWNKGVIPYSELQLELSRISDSLLQVVENTNKNKIYSRSKFRRYRVALFLLFLTFLDYGKLSSVFIYLLGVITIVTGVSILTSKSNINSTNQSGTHEVINIKKDTLKTTMAKYGGTSDTIDMSDVSAKGNTSESKAEKKIAATSPKSSTPKKTKVQIDEENYNELVAQAENKYNSGDYLKAKTLYEKALAYIRNGRKALNGIDRCGIALGESPSVVSDPPVNTKTKVQIDEVKYRELIMKAEKIYNCGDYQTAKFRYLEALAIRKSSAEALNGIDRCNSALNVQSSKVTKPENDAAIDDDEIFTVVQDMPRFPGCECISVTSKDKKSCAEKEMLEFIYKSIKYPTVAIENGIEGRVIVSFVVEKDGSITNPKILRGLGGGCSAEALRVVKSMPKWIPGKQRNKAVRVQFNVFVGFKLPG